MITQKKMFIFFFLLIITFAKSSAQDFFKPIWTPLNRLYKGAVRDVAFDSAGHMFICADKMYVSEDSGKTGDIYLDKLVKRIFIGPYNYIYISTSEGLFLQKSFNSDWVKLTEISPRSMAFSNDSKIFIGSGDGLHYSSDGENWTQIKSMGLDSVGVNAVYVDAAGRIYAGGFLRPSPESSLPYSARLYRSEDYGDTWQKLSIPDSVRTISTSNIFITDDNKIFVGSITGIYKSEDDGKTWNTTGFPSEGCWRMILNNNKIFAISLWGKLWRSIDYGYNWDILYDTSGIDVSCIGINDSGEIYIGTSNGLLLSADDGQTWEQILNVNITIPALCITFDWNGNPIIGTENGVYRSTDNGDSWFISGLQGRTVISLSRSPKGYVFSVTSDSGLYRSNDTAKSWSKAGLGTIVSSPGIISIDSSGNIFYAIWNTIYKSTDDGESWDKVFNYSFLSVSGISISKIQNIYAVIDSVGIFRSTDGGVNWSEASNGIPEKFVCNIVNSGDYLFAPNWGVSRTTEDEINWHLVGLRDVTVENLSVDSKGNIYAYVTISGSYIKKIYLSTDYGESWSIIDSTYSDDKVIFLGINDNDYIFAVTKNGMILRSFNSITSVFDNKNFVLSTFILQQNYPNPFNPSTKISWQSPVSSWQTLKVYDVLGNEIATLVDEFKSAGSYEVEFSAKGGLASGFYFYQLKAGSFVQNK